MIPQTPAPTSSDAPNPFNFGGGGASLSSPPGIAAMRLSSPSPLASGSGQAFSFGTSTPSVERPSFDFRGSTTPGWPGMSGGASTGADGGGLAASPFGFGSSASPIPPTPGVTERTFDFAMPSSSPSISLRRAGPTLGGPTAGGVPSGSIAATTSIAAVPFRPQLPAVASASAVPSTYIAYVASSLLPLLTPPTPTPSAPSLAAVPLILDIRPHSAFSSAHIISSISVCVPSTLLRRATYTLAHLLSSLPVPDQIALRTSPSIVVIDADSLGLKDGLGVRCLLDKFAKDENFNGTLGWVKGGFAALKNECVVKGVVSKLIESGSGSGSGSTGTSSADPSERTQGAASVPGKHGRPVLSVKDLPQSAFTQSSTAAFVHSGSTARSSHGGRPSSSHATSPYHKAPSSSSDGSGSSLRPNLVKRRKSGGGMMINLNSVASQGGGIVAMGLAEGSETPGAGAAPGGFTEEVGEKRMATNPFFDNIRQNSEALSLDRSLANLSLIDLPSVPSSLLSTLPPFLSTLLCLPPTERSHLLARQFYDLEVAERERLEGTLNWHANHQGKENEDHSEEATRFKKFGISAGVELGSLNRFKNIFPYEHARVKLTNHSRHATDYINASHIRLQSSSTSFIASQGPLAATFPDFWQMCDQENVGVIVMLTNLEEGGREKCGRYWVQQHGCEWHVDVQGEEDQADAQGGGFFSNIKVAPPQDDARTIRRTISIQSTKRPHAQQRRIRHIQYRAWPDFDIPAKASDVVDLVHEVEAAQRNYLQESGWRRDPRNDYQPEPPILVHCSAGVGRTGVFIMVTTMLEKLRRERHSRREAEAVRDTDSMDIDQEEERSHPMVHRGSNASANSASSTLSLSPLPSPASVSSNDSAAMIAAGLRASTLGPSTAHGEDSSSSLSSVTSSVSGGLTTGSTAATSPSPSPVNLAFSASSLELPPLERPEPIFAATNEMREQRMSMIANYRQYVCVHECVLEGLLKEVAEESTM